MSTLAKVGPQIGFRIIGLANGDNPAAQVQAARRRRKMTQQDAAFRAGVSVPTMRAVERGTASMAALTSVLTVLSPKAREAIPAQAHWQVKRDVRFTPPEVVEWVLASFGPIALDPAGDPRCFVPAERVLTQADDGLATLWSGRMAFVNPPFSDLTRWIGRCCDAWDRQEVEMIVGLFPARTETTTFRERVFGIADVLLMPRRLSFYDEHRTKMAPAPFALMVCVWGAERDRVLDFAARTGALVLWATDGAKTKVGGLDCGMEPLCAA
ncbi:DNA N-6-adenine-methyltransferase [Sphingomonas sp. Leaf339]|uniref:DNA N-6-adenine-methyltransferase n=1 Tax=Sphingomonas sp. Leaf339 TaxID=1736343 RepID=UPI00138ED7A4|nr:DNA N-6-adenine-methyltransferase [Sphingomonas sp. Leaf339]